MDPVSSVCPHFGREFCAADRFSLVPLVAGLLCFFQHHCRGCGQVYCSAHAPPTPVPPEDRSLKLCWSCVLEGAVPLPASLLEDDDEEGEADNHPGTAIGLPPSSARGIAGKELLSPVAASTAAARGGSGGGGGHADRGQGGKKGEGGGGGGGFLSALVSLIEGVASPTSPMRARGGAAGGASKKPGARRPPAASSSPGPALATATSQSGRTDDDSGEGEGDWRAGWSTPAADDDESPAARSQSGRGDTSPLVLRKEYDSGSGSRGQLLEKEDIRGFASHSTAGSLTESGDDLLRGGGADNGGRTSGGGTASKTVVENGIGELLDEKPVELGFPSERPWAHGFGV